MTYNVVIEKRAQRELRRLPVRTQERIAESIGLLVYNPNAHQRDIKLLKNDPEAKYRLRVGSYRLKFDRDDKLRVISITRIAHRKDAYK